MSTFRDPPESTFSSQRPRRSPKPLSDEQSLYEYALGSLGRGMRTVAQLKRLMQRRVADPQSGAVLIDAVLARLQSHQYLSDARYAAAYSTLRKEGRRLGSRRVAQDLRQKGVPADVIAREVEAAYEGTDEATQARLFLARKRAVPPAPGDDRAKARLFRMLGRAGFSPAIALQVLRSWSAAPDEATDPT